MDVPAPLETIREKLASPTADVRVVALMHARAHGEHARTLAPLIARCFEDESPAVAWHAMGAFLAVGRDAAEAVPVLVAQLERGKPPMLVRRALHALACVGPAARAALAVMERLPKDEQDMDALLAVAPNDSRVIALCTERVLADVGEARFIAKLPARALDDVTRAVIERLGDPAQRKAACGYLFELQRLRLDELYPVAAGLLDDPDPEVVGYALAIVSKRPLDAGLVAKLVHLATHSDADLRRSVLEHLGEARAPEVRAIAHAALARLAHAAPLSGDDRAAGYEVQAAAEALVRAAPDDRVGGELLVAWLGRLPSLAVQHPRLNLYPVGHVLQAAASLLPSDPRVGDVAVALASMSMKQMNRDESGVLDFHRTLRRLAATDAQLMQRLVGTGMPRVDPYAVPEEQQEAGAALPDFPPEAPPPPPLSLAVVPEAVLRERDRFIARARTLTGVMADAAPEQVVETIEALVRQRGSVSDADRRALGMLWGQALERRVGWQWRLLVWGDERTLGLASHDGTYACDVSSFVSRQIARDDVTIVLTFNMIVAGNLPEAQPGRVTLLH